MTLNEKIRELFVETIGYRFFPCLYNRFHDPIFEFIGSKTPKDFFQRTKKKGFKVQVINFNDNFPKGEMATFTFSLHHAYDKEKALKEVVKNFKYIFICEPCLDLYHWLFDAAHVPSKEKWLEIFKKVLKKYTFYQYKRNLIVFFKK